MWVVSDFNHAIERYLTLSSMLWIRLCRYFPEFNFGKMFHSADGAISVLENKPDLLAGGPS